MLPFFKKRTPLFVAALLSLLTFRNAVTAQNPPSKKLLFETLTINDGLSQGMVNWIMQDRYGFMWFATKDGLNRYDGYQFTVYRHDPADTSSVADNYIESVFEDAKGRLWVGTASQGLDLFNRETETFRHFKRYPKDNSPFERVSSITEDKQGRLWAATENGVVVMTEEKYAKTDLPTFTFRKINNNESRVFVAQNGTVWISELNGDLVAVRRSPVGKERTDTIPLASYCRYKKKDYGLEKYVFAFAEDTPNRKLYLFLKNCITVFDEEANAFRIHLKTEESRYNFTSSVTNKTIWLVNTYRLQQYDVTTSRLAFVNGADPETERLTGDVRFVYTGRDGIVWVGTAGFGILKYNPRSEKFHHTGTESIRWMAETNTGKILVGKDGAYLNLFDKRSGAYEGTVPDSTVIRSAAYNYGVVEGGIQDDDGTYWICKESLVNYNAITRTFTRYLAKNSFPVFKDKAGEVWFGGNNSFCRYDKRTKEFFDHPYPTALPNSPYKSLQAVYRDDGGVFWLGTTAGLLRFDPFRQSWKHFKNDPADFASLSFDLIFSLCPDPVQPDKYLWIGTNGGGLNRFDKTNGKATRYSATNGLANDVVYGILSDNEGNLWMSTNNGLSKLDRERKNFHNYNAADGLQSNEFNRNAFCKTKDGFLFFGGVNGFNYFNPTELQESGKIPNIVISGFKIRNQPVSFRVQKSPLSKPVYLTDQIVLPYGDNMLSFDFVALDYTNPGKNRYQYRLEGFDDQWIQSGTKNSATYTNLDPGTYTFRVKGSNSDGVWNENGRSLQLVVLPPWYMTWWFRIAVAAAFSAAVYAFYRYRLTQALKLQVIRNRIASDLHDEIGSALSNISIFSDVAQKKLQSQREETGHLLRKISDHARVSMEAMSDIVWMINSRNDRFENIIVRMRTLAADLFEATGRTLHLHFDERLNHVTLNMQERKNFYLIYKEAINNTAKYSGGKDVWIEMTLKDGEICLLIKDNGKGFDLRNGKKGNGLFNMQKRTDALKGKLNVTSETGKGTTVELRLRNRFF